MEGGQPARQDQKENISHLILSDNAIGGQQESCFASFCRWFMMAICSMLMCLVPCMWCSYIKVFEQYERAVHFRLGKLQRPAKGPGIFVFIPCIDDWRTVDMRILTLDVPSQDMMTKDSVTCKVNAVCYFYVADAIKSVTCVENHVASTALLAQTTLRSVIGDSELDEVLQKREIINNKLRRILDEGTDDWGIKVVAVEVKDVTLPQSMQRSMGSQAEAERERRAKVISADGEFQASAHLLEAANNMTQNPATIQLRYLQTLSQISQEKPSTIIFPLPLSLRDALPFPNDHKEHKAGEPAMTYPGVAPVMLPGAGPHNPLDAVVSGIASAVTRS